MLVIIREKVYIRNWIGSIKCSITTLAIWIARCSVFYRNLFTLHTFFPPLGVFLCSMHFLEVQHGQMSKVFTTFFFVRLCWVFQFSFLLLVSCCLPIIFSSLFVRLIPFVCYYHPAAYVTVCMSTVYRWKGAELCSRRMYFGCIKCTNKCLVSNLFLESY